MSDEAKRLLGGHATDTLTEAERRELMRAALDDQETFDCLLEAEGLRELLADPAARQAVLRVPRHVCERFFDRDVGFQTGHAAGFEERAGKTLLPPPFAGRRHGADRHGQTRA